MIHPVISPRHKCKTLSAFVTNLLYTQNVLPTMQSLILCDTTYFLVCWCLAVSYCHDLDGTLGCSCYYSLILILFYILLLHFIRWNIGMFHLLFADSCFTCCYCMLSDKCFEVSFAFCYFACWLPCGSVAVHVCCMVCCVT